MRLVKATGALLAAMTLFLCFAAGVHAQAPAAKKAKPAAKGKSAAAKPKAPAAPKPAPAATPAAPAGEEAQAADKTEAVNKRDPFAPLVNQKKGNATLHLPPGKAGLVVATVRVDGTVRAQSGMIAIVSNPNNSVYFVREGDRLYDGDVEKIGLDGVTFRENSKDAFGHEVERMVTKRIYASAGEQQ
jgi:Tfp pilus assembly protein PilP